jgi:UDP-N-acetylmuramoylalanine--D-glutamate ligase
VRLADLRGRSVAVWGTGREGRAAVNAIAVHDPARLIAVNDSAGYLDDPWDDPRAPLAGGEHAFAALVSADVVVRSPDVPGNHPFLAELRARGITVTGGSALWMADHAGRSVGVTGSDGGSVTAALISRLLTASGRPNLHTGDPLLDLPPAELYVLELSGHQCADLADSPRVAVVTSLLPERPGARGDERESCRDMLNILGHGPDLIVVDGTDEHLRDEIRGVTDRNRFPAVPVAAGDSRFRVEDGTVFCSDEPLFGRSSLRLKGARYERGLCIALAVLDGVGVDVVGTRAGLEEAVRSFEGLPHHLAEIEDPSGVTFVDDACSTSPHSAIHAIEAYEGRALTVLIGGTDLDVDYAPLQDFLASRELTVIGLPDSGPRILARLSTLPKITAMASEDLADAVRLAREVTPAGGVILLSPAAPGHGRFRDPERRAEAFAEAIRATAG